MRKDGAGVELAQRAPQRLPAMTDSQLPDFGSNLGGADGAPRQPAEQAHDPTSAAGAGRPGTPRPAQGFMMDLSGRRRRVSTHDGDCEPSTGPGAAPAFRKPRTHFFPDARPGACHMESTVCRRLRWGPALANRAAVMNALQEFR